MRQYLKIFSNADLTAIKTILAAQDKRLQLKKKGFLRYQEPLAAIGHIRAHHHDYTTSKVIIGRKNEISDDDHQLIYQALRAFMPWRKGPFSIFDIEVDGEWRSEKKWQRLAPELPDLNGKIIADIGCNNGYYMFRMAPHEPRLVLGFEPMLQHHYTFKALNSMAKAHNLRSELLGVEHLNLFPNSFDIIFLMGIIYHRISPVEMLKDIKNALHPGGTLILESQAIPGTEPVALFPEKTYAKVPGTYFVPTASCAINWLQRAGFSDCKLFAAHPMSGREQRRTDWMLFESYADYIDPTNPALTVEGYPAPERIYIKAVNR